MTSVVGTVSIIAHNHQWESARQELQQKLNRTPQGEELLCVAPAAHKSADNLRARRVWIGIAKARSSEQHFVFIFARTRYRCFWRCNEWIYCVVPVLHNIRIDIEPQRCVLTWRQNEKQTYQVGVHKSRLGDCFIEDVKDTSGFVMKTLAECYAGAKVAAMENSYKDMWQNLKQYELAIPLDLKTLAKKVGQQQHHQHQLSHKPSAFGGRERTTTTGTDPKAVSSNMTMEVGEAQGLSQRLKLFFITWNVGATKPLPNATMGHMLNQESGLDIVVVALQEVCKLDSAKNLVFETEEAVKWCEWVVDDIRDTFSDTFDLVQKVVLVGMAMLVFVRRPLMNVVNNVYPGHLGFGIFGQGGNKGAVGVRMEIEDTSFCFINAHLDAHQDKYVERCKNWKLTMTKLEFCAQKNQQEGEDGVSSRSSRESRKSKIETPKSVSRLSITNQSLFGEERVSYLVDQHDHIFWMGDTNMRLHWGKAGGMPLGQAAQRIRDLKLGELLSLDQLNMSRRSGIAFTGFEEGRILFMPTYKWRKNHEELDMRDKRHVPAWTDRILYQALVPQKLKAESTVYNIHLGLQQSDHRPVYGCYVMPWTGELYKEHEQEDDDTAQDAASTRSGAEQQLVTLSVESVIFEAVQPDQTYELKVLLRRCPVVTSGVVLVKARLVGEAPESEQKEVAYQSLERSLWQEAMTPASSRVQGTPSMQRPKASAEAEDHTDMVSDLDAVDLAKALTLNPVEGAVRGDEPMELSISLNVAKAIQRRYTVECMVEILVNWQKACCSIRLPVAALLQPSIHRLPLSILANLGSTSINDWRPGGGALSLSPSTIAETISGSADLQVTLSGLEKPVKLDDLVLPPKEIRMVMAWLFQQSQAGNAGALEELQPASSEDGTESMTEVWAEARLVQSAVESGQPMAALATATLRGGLHFLLHWLTSLPQPIVNRECVSKFNEEKKSLREYVMDGVSTKPAMQALEALPRSCLACLGALMGQLHRKDKTKEENYAMARFALALAHKSDLVEDTKELLKKLAVEASRNSDKGRFPPVLSLHAVGCVKPSFSIQV